MKWFMLLSGAIATGLAPWMLSSEWPWSSVCLGAYGVLATTIGIRRFRMKKEIKVEQSGITTGVNTGVSVRNVPTGVELPPIKVNQTDIKTRENTGLDLSYSPDSGPVRMNFTEVKGDFGKVVINPEFGQVIINPSVGTVKFNRWK